MSTKRLPWIEKYRPASLSDVISHANVIHTLNTFIKKGTLPNIILFGPPGIGKTSIIKACAKKLYGDDVNLMTLEINASEERGIDIVRNTISHFASCVSTFTVHCENLSKLVILDEADSMTYDAQIALKNVIDVYSNVHFCLVCNCIKKIHYSLISRCIKLRLHPIRDSDIITFTKNVCSKENIKITDDAINELVKYSNGDMRKIINALQSMRLSYQNITSTNIINYLNRISNEQLLTIIDTICENNIRDAYKIVSDIINTNGYSIHEIIVGLNDLILQNIINTSHTENKKSIIFEKYDERQLFDILYQLGKIEYQIFSNVPISTLMVSLICRCKLI
jgi:replication factor C subunit 3/5